MAILYVFLRYLFRYNSFEKKNRKSENVGIFSTYIELDTSILYLYCIPDICTKYKNLLIIKIVALVEIYIHSILMCQ